MAKNYRSSIAVDRDTAAVFKAAADKVKAPVGDLLRFAAMKPIFMEGLLRVYIEGVYAENLGLLAKPGRRASSGSSSASGSSAESPEPRSSGSASVDGRAPSAPAVRSSPGGGS